jgi:hypothetical protein
MLHDSGINRTLNLLKNDLTQIGLGIGTGINAQSDKLNIEITRGAVTTAIIDGNVVVLEAFFDDHQANGTFTEIGLYGNGATSIGSSGELFASSSGTITKNNTEALTVSFEIEVKEVV